MLFRCIPVIAIFLIASFCGTYADIKTIPPGGTVFIGEEQVDISGSGLGPGSQIAWWAPGTSLDESPADIITISDPTRFSALTSSFSGREGVWYALSGKTPVFKIKQPKTGICIYDTISDFDATGKWLPKGHIASFQIETNMHEMRSRPDVTGAPFDIIITTPNGASYSSVSGPAGSFSLTGIPVLSSMHDTGPVWYTGGGESGTYSFRAECTANRINSNNPDEGAGVSQTETVLIQDINPLSPTSREVSVESSDGSEEEWGSENRSQASVSTQEQTPSPTQFMSGTGTPAPGQVLHEIVDMVTQTPPTIVPTDVPIINHTPNETMVPVVTPSSARTSSPVEKTSFPVVMTIIALFLVARRN